MPTASIRAVASYLYHYSEYALILCEARATKLNGGRLGIKQPISHVLSCHQTEIRLYSHSNKIAFRNLFRKLYPAKNCMLEVNFVIAETSN